jgi:uncharacterized protein (UPF0147 family)
MDHMQKAYELAVKADRLLHPLMDRDDVPRDIKAIATEAHDAVHDIAAFLSPDPEIQASLTR